MIKAGLLHVPFGTGKHAPIAAEDQGRVIAGILEDPAPHKGGIYPLFGPVEYTYQETAQLLSRILGKDVRYKQVDFEEYLKTVKSGGRKPSSGESAMTFYGELERKPGYGDSFFIQHIKEVVIDHQNGVFEGTNDLVEKLGGRPPDDARGVHRETSRGFRLKSQRGDGQPAPCLLHLNCLWRRETRTRRLHNSLEGIRLTFNTRRRP